MLIFIDYDKSKDRGIIRSEQLDGIREHFSVKDDKANIKKRFFKTRYIPERLYCITSAGRFEIGLLPDILKYLKELNVPFKLILSEEFKERYKTGYNFNDGLIYELSIDARSYQTEALKTGLHYGSGIYLHPTGSGKTLLMSLLIHNISKRIGNTKVLVISPTHLVDQTANEFINCGINPNDINKWSGTNDLNPNSKIVICGNHILYNKIDNISLEIKKIKIVYLTLEKKLKTDLTLTDAEIRKIKIDIEELKTQIKKLEVRNVSNQHIHDYLRSVNLLLLDECHTLKQKNKLDEFFKFIHTRHRFFFTGTLPENKLDEWNLIGKSGPVIHDVERDFLVKNNYIADVDVRVIKLFYNKPPTYDTFTSDSENDDIDENNPTANYQLELDYIINNLFRNNIITTLTKRVDKNILITVDRILHGEILYKLIKDSINTKQIYFIRGKTEDVEREEIKKLMENNNNVVCIAISSIFSTGINIKNLHYIILASIGKAKTRLIQTIGRGVRILDGKNKVVIFDIADILRYGYKHLERRMKLYENEGIKYKVTEVRESS